MTDKIIMDGRIADGLHDIAESIRELAASIRYATHEIGQGSPHTPGALEFIGMQMRDGIKVRIESEE